MPALPGPAAPGGRWPPEETFGYPVAGGRGRAPAGSQVTRRTEDAAAQRRAGASSVRLTEAALFRRWRSRSLVLVLPLATARALCARAQRVDEVWDAKRGMRTATVALPAASSGTEARAAVGWCRLRWYDGGEAAVLELVAWDARRSEADAWAAAEALAGGPVRPRHRPGADR